MSVQVKGSGTIGGLDEGLVVSGIVTSSTQINVGSNIKLGSAGVVTATSFVGSGANLTGITSPAITSIGSDGAARVLTSDGDGTATAHSFVTVESNRLSVNRGSGSGAYPLIVRRTDASGIIAEFANSSGYGLLIGQNSATGEAYLRTGTGQDMVFTTNAGSGIANERLRITSGGLVGIGSITPANQLDIQGGSHTKIHVGTTGTGHATGIQINHAKGNAALQEWQLQTDATSTANLIIRNATSGVTIQTFGTAGEITTPKQPIFATRINYVNSYVSSGTKIQMQAAHIDTRSGFSDANDRYTAPAAGRYLFYFFSNIDYNGDGTIAVRFHRNGSEFTSGDGGHIYSYAQNSGWHGLCGQIITNMAANDYIEVFSQSNNSKFDGNSYGQFGGYMIG